MKYLCQVWFDTAAIAAIDPADGEILTRDSIANDDRLRDSGHLVVALALTAPATAVTVKVGSNSVAVTDGPFAELKEHLGGFVLIEAADIDEAARIAATFPVARYGAIEVRPAYDIRFPRPDDGPQQPALPMAVVEALYRTHSRRVLATLIRLLGDFDRAEEALHDAFTAASGQWTAEKMPANPVAWLVSAGRYRAIDRLRRQARFEAAATDIADSLYPEDATVEIDDKELLEDDMLRLIFSCCHPLLPAEAQMAMALRELCGLTTEEIANAFVVPVPTVAQRIVRAKNRIRTAGIAYEVPERAEWAERLGCVLQVIYLLFNEGYLASSGTALVRPDLAGEAVRLGRLLADLLPQPEVFGLLALMLLQDSRRAARTGPGGALVLLADQDRSLWSWETIAEGLALTERFMRQGVPGPYLLQAAIAAEHARARTATETDWRRISGIYDLLLACQPTPVVALNRAVAVSMDRGPAAALTIVDDILSDGRLSNYHLAHAARADFLRQLGRASEARQAYAAALALCRQQQEADFLRSRIAALPGN